MASNETPTKGITMIEFILAAACIIAVGVVTNIIGEILTK